MQVILRDGESFEEMFRRFKRGVETSGILREFKRKQRFKPNHEIRRDKIQAAIRRRRRSRSNRG
jgi:ribosomal protein S21